MDKLVIRGGNPLLGTVRISGAKNAALPAMAAALLTDEPVVLENIPQVRDIETTRRLLASMGAEVELGYGRAHHRTTISCAKLANPEATYELVKTMRASTLVLGPLVARCCVARVSLPGGCAIGARPIDLHIKGLERLGATITTEHGYVVARAERLKGGHVVFDKITVTGTEDLLMAATLADGETLMENCAREPEVADLAALLVKMGAQIEGAGPEAYDALVIPGGRAPEYIRLEDKVLDAVRHFAKSNKPIAAICHGAQVLAAAGIIEGKACTAYPAVGPEVKKAGGKWMEIAVDKAYVDGHLVTAPAWPAHPEWLAKFLKVLGTKIEP